MAGVVRALAERELLIVLDSCEHVLASAARVVAMLAGHCPQVRILTTSREHLDAPGEFVFPVPPLGLPEDGSVRAVAASEAGHRSLDALVSWSYELLGEAERRPFARLSVLRGGFDLEVAERHVRSRYPGRPGVRGRHRR